jgi:mono/diheme cytochrome c family protein
MQLGVSLSREIKLKRGTIMSKKSLFICASLAVAIGSGRLFASDSNQKISPADGKAMYSSYCAPCHGVNGKGNASVASSLKRTPTDLTMLSRNNHGVYPSGRVVGVIGHGTSASGHDRAGMPDWAARLATIDQNNKLDTPLRINNLSKYLETLQSK